MRYELKYIIVNHKGCELPIIFSAIFDHSEISKNKSVVSAGTVVLPDELNHRVSCYGESVTLNGLKSRGDVDVHIIEKHIFD